METLTLRAASEKPRKNEKPSHPTVLVTQVAGVLCYLEEGDVLPLQLKQRCSLPGSIWPSNHQSRLTPTHQSQFTASPPFLQPIHVSAYAPKFEHQRKSSPFSCGMCLRPVIWSVVMLWQLTSGVLRLFGQFTQGSSESGVCRLGNCLPIG